MVKILGETDTIHRTSGSATVKATGSSTTTGTSATATKTNAAGSKSPQVAMALLVAGFVGQYLL